MTGHVEFEVIGVPKPQGSKRAFKDKAGNARMKEDGGFEFAAWRNAVARAAKDVAGHDDVLAPLDGPLVLLVDFRFPMPKSRPKRDRERGEAHKTSAPDLDKLVRTIGDALTASGLIVDDARFVAINATKVETTGWTGAVVRVERL